MHGQVAAVLAQDTAPLDVEPAPVLATENNDAPPSPRQQHLLAFLTVCRNRTNYVRIETDPICAGLLIGERGVYAWAIDRTNPERELDLTLAVNGHVVWSDRTAPASVDPLLETGYRLTRHRTMTLTAGGKTAQAPAFEGWMPFPDASIRKTLAQEFDSGIEELRAAECADRLWTGLQDVMARLDRQAEATARPLPPPYVRFLCDRFEYTGKLSSHQAIGSWIIADVLEDTDKRRLFCLTDVLLGVLSEPVFNRRVLRAEVTVALFAFWRRHYRTHDIFSDADLRAVQYKFATAPYINDKNNRLLITSEMRERLSSPADPYREGDLIWSWYWLFLHEDQRVSDKLRDPAYARLVSFRETVTSELRPSRLSFNPSAWRSYWRSLCGDRSQGFTRFDMAMISLLGDESIPESAIAALGVDHWRQRLLNDVYRRVPELALLGGLEPSGVEAQATPPSAPIVPKVHNLAIIGHAKQTGLGRNFTMFIEALAGMDPLLYNIDDGSSLNTDLTSGDLLPERAKVVLLCVNADRAPEAIARFAHVCEGAHIVAFFLWETDRPPQSHHAGAHMVDEIWCPTEYVTEAYRKITSVPVITIGKGLKPAPPRPPHMLEHVIRRDAGEFVFLYVAEFGSGLMRKNPLDGIRAFQEAFQDDEPVRFCLKIREIDPGHWSNVNGYWEEIEERVAADPRLCLITGDLSEDEYYSLVETADAYVSLHRAEGFGYGVSDAMFSRRPVIVSDYSGTCDFCTEETAFLVGVDPQPVPPECMRTRGYVGNWAVPRIAEAAAAMRRVFEDRVEATRRADKAAVLLQAKYNMPGWRQRIESLLAPHLAAPEEIG
jgi:glycosyltransferase involved in cell wall biosynthesis